MDKSGASYRRMLSQLSEGNNVKGKALYSFIEQWSGLEKREEFDMQNCIQQILSDSTQYKSHTYLKFQATMEKEVTLFGDFQPELLATKMLGILSAKDLELDFYKFKFFSYWIWHLRKINSPETYLPLRHLLKRKTS